MGRRRFRKPSRSAGEHFDGKHRYEHWYLDNQVYFITARCRDQFPAFASEQAKLIFWTAGLITRRSSASRLSSRRSWTTTTTVWDI
jgi:hypothetical protein